MYAAHAALLAIVSAAAPEGVGVNVHLPWTDLHVVEKAASIGMDMIRVDANWDIVEGASDAPDVPVAERTPTADYFADAYWFEATDRVVCEASRHGMDAYLLLAYTPCWATEPGQACGTGALPQAGKYDAYVFAMVRRYAGGFTCADGSTGRATHFGMWNEANLSLFWTSSMQEYVDRILIPGAAAVRAACPECTVVGPDLSSQGEYDDALEVVLCDPAGRASLDVLGHHIYNGFTEMGQDIWVGDSYTNILDDQRFVFTRRSVRQVMEQCDALDLPVWITETGRGSPVDDPEALAIQADYLTHALGAQLDRDWVTRTFVYHVADDVAEGGDGLWSCPIAPDGTFMVDCVAKPAVAAIADYIATHAAFHDAPPDAGFVGDAGHDDEAADAGVAGADAGAAHDDDGATNEDAGTVLGAHDAGAVVGVDDGVDEDGADDDEAPPGCAAAPRAEVGVLALALLAMWRRRSAISSHRCGRRARRLRTRCRP